jgi:hypothetical protein
VILAAAAGGAVEHFTGYAGALAIGLVLGLIVAQLVPAKTSCGVGRAPPPP